MQFLIYNIPSLAFLGIGVYLIMNDHSTAGGWLCFAGVCMHHSSGGDFDDSLEKNKS